MLNTWAYMRLYGATELYAVGSNKGVGGDVTHRTFCGTKDRLDVVHT